jgi:DNA-binding protein Fis
LAKTKGNQSEAARSLGLSRATFLDKLKRYNLWTHKGD